MPSGSATRRVTSSPMSGSPSQSNKPVVAVHAEVEVLEEGQQGEVRADRDDQGGSLPSRPRTVGVEPLNRTRPGARSTESDHEARDVVDERREQQQEREQRVRPAVEDEADDRQDQMLRPPRNGVIQQQSDREEVEEEEIRAEDHPTAKPTWLLRACGASARLADARDRSRERQAGAPGLWGADVQVQRQA